MIDICKAAERISAKYKAGSVFNAKNSFMSLPPDSREKLRPLLGDVVMFAIDTLLADEKKRKAEKLLAESMALDALKKIENGKQAQKQYELESLKDFVGCETDETNKAKIAARSGFWQQDLDKFLTAGQRKACRDFRNNAMWGKAVKEALGCSDTELDRWDKDGRLPHSFKSDCSAGGKIVKGRKWFRDEVLSAKSKVDEWRNIDAHRKVCKRTKLKAVA